MGKGIPMKKFYLFRKKQFFTKSLTLSLLFAIIIRFFSFEIRSPFSLASGTVSFSPEAHNRITKALSIREGITYRCTMEAYGSLYCKASFSNGKKLYISCKHGKNLQFRIYNPLGDYISFQKKREKEELVLLPKTTGNPEYLFYLLKNNSSSPVSFTFRLRQEKKKRTKKEEMASLTKKKPPATKKKASVTPSPSPSGQRQRKKSAPKKPEKPQISEIKGCPHFLKIKRGEKRRLPVFTCSGSKREAADRKEFSFLSINPKIAKIKNGCLFSI